VNSIILSKNELSDGNIYELNKSSSEHLNSIIKAQAGDKLKATILDKGLAICEVLEVSPLFKVKVIEELEGKSFPISFVIGASRPPTMKKVLEHGSSLGIQNFQVIKGELSEKSYLQSKVLQDEKYLELTRLGLSQSAVFYKDPTVKINPFLNKMEIPETEQKFILSPYAKEHVKDISIDIEKPSVFAIGPERGWTDSELDKFKKLGFKEIKISPSILRVEIATFALMGYLNQLMD